MNILEFEVHNRILERIDTQDVINQSKNAYKCCFTFDDESEWIDEDRFVIFTDGWGNSSTVYLGNEGNVLSCIIPNRVLQGSYFQLYVCTDDSPATNEVSVPLIQSGYDKKDCCLYEFECEDEDSEFVNVLEFEVHNQILERIDNYEVINQSKNVYKCSFTFEEGSEWIDEDRFVIFTDGWGNSSTVYLGNEGNVLSCIIPNRVLQGSYFQLSVYSGNLITTNQISVLLIQSGYNRKNCYTSYLGCCDEDCFNEHWEYNEHHTHGNVDNHLDESEEHNSSIQYSYNEANGFVPHPTHHHPNRYYHPLHYNISHHCHNKYCHDEEDIFAKIFSRLNNSVDSIIYNDHTLHLFCRENLLESIYLPFILEEEFEGLVDNLVSRFIASNRLPTASSESDGLLSKEDKLKLDSIEEGANKIVVDTVLDIESENPIANKTVTEALNGKEDSYNIIERVDNLIVNLINEGE